MRKNGENIWNRMNRRKFIQNTAVLGTVSAFHSCSPDEKINGRITGASVNIGHLLRDKAFKPSSTSSKTDVVIIGAGISGLSAGRWLLKNSISNFKVLDLENYTGGNACGGSNEISGYPNGAHYIPIPNNDLVDFLAFLEESKVITGWDENNLPVYNEYYLCFDPQERLYINGRWQEGLIPQYGVPEADKKQIAEFLSLMDEMRHAKGDDGKDAFAIPINNSSKDPLFTSLDNITMQTWLKQHKLSSAYLHWYINYCTRDDFGTGYEKISAWAAIHYFAARKGKGANAEAHDVITWPEGNFWLVRKLVTSFQEKIINNALVVKVKRLENEVLITYFDNQQQVMRSIKAKQCILSVPQFVAARLIDDQERLEKVHQNIQYAPWMVANLKVGKLEERNGAPFSWDNVIYDSNSLGYVHASHELLNSTLLNKNITYYLPLDHLSPSEVRKDALKKTHQEWAVMVLNDLEKIHPNIKSVTKELNVTLWGHAMAQPIPGMIHGPVRHELSKPVNNLIHFAHTDIAGVSIFEEAFYQGINAAKKVVEQLA